MVPRRSTRSRFGFLMLLTVLGSHPVVADSPRQEPPRSQEDASASWRSLPFSYPRAPEAPVVRQHGAKPLVSALVSGGIVATVAGVVIAKMKERPTLLRGALWTVGLG